MKPIFSALGLVAAGNQQLYLRLSHVPRQKLHVGQRDYRRKGYRKINTYHSEEKIFQYSQISSLRDKQHQSKLK